MNFDFELILFYATLVSGLLVLLDVLFIAKRRKVIKDGQAVESKPPLLIDYARAFFPVFLLVFVLRSFLYEGFRIPTGSLEPSLLVGDFIVVNKYDYGLRLPVLHKKFVDVSEPKRGDIFVFHWPPNPSYYFVKRVVGIPGDHISYINKVLYVNGIKADQEFLKNTTNKDQEGNDQPVVELQENLLGIKHNIFQIPADKTTDLQDIVVPAGMYFAMGDNRDDSADSRYWGFVPEANIVGKAVAIFSSWNSDASWSTPWKKIRWERSFKSI